MCYVNKNNYETDMIVMVMSVFSLGFSQNKLIQCYTGTTDGVEFCIEMVVPETIFTIVTNLPG